MALLLPPIMTIKPRQFFRILWQINAVFIFLGGLGVLIGLGGIFGEILRPATVSNVSTIDPVVPTKTVFFLGSFTRFKNTPQYIAPLEFTQEYQLDISRNKESIGTSNYLFFNVASQTSRWLLPENKYVLTSLTPLTVLDQADEAPRWIQYVVIKADTNKNGQLESNDQLTLALSNLNGTNYQELIPKIDRLLGTEMQDKDTLVVFYQSGSDALATTINLPKFQIQQTTKLPEIP